MNVTFDRITSIALAILGVLIVVESNKMVSVSFGSSVSAKTFPFYLGIVLIILSVLLFFESFKKVYPYEKSEPINKNAYMKFGIFLVSIIAYASLIEPLGYIISTFIFLAINFQLIDRGKIVRTLIIALAFSVTIYVVYVEVMKGSLPGFPAWLGF